MKTLIITICTMLTGMAIACSDGTSAVTPGDSTVIGRWTLTRVTYPMTQTTQSPADAGFSETLEFLSNGTYKRNLNQKNGLQEQSGKFYTGENSSKTGEKMAIFYPDDKMMQPYTLKEGKLVLYERTPIGATLADGAYYEYAK